MALRCSNRRRPQTAPDKLDELRAGIGAAIDAAGGTFTMTYAASRRTRRIRGQLSERNDVTTGQSTLAGRAKVRTRAIDTAVWSADMTNAGLERPSSGHG
jgi:hypothetical protein